MKKLTNFNVVVQPGVPKSVALDVKVLLYGLERTTPIRHRICVLLVNKMALDCDDAKAVKLKRQEEAVFGLFCVPGRGGENRRLLEAGNCWPDPKADCTIILATRLGLLAKRNKAIKNCPLKIVRAFLFNHTFHEVFHYTQWRDKKSVTERGMKKNINGLVERFIKSKLSGRPLCAKKK